MNIFYRYRHLVIILLLGFPSIIFSQTFLNPNNFTSLGTFNSSGNVTIDMGTGQMSGGASFTGVVNGDVLVFTFASFILNSGHSITFTNVSDLGHKVVFLSQGDMTISGIINANASGQTAGPGGGFGGVGGSIEFGISGNPGSGTGAATGTDGGGGAGFGGAGGTVGGSTGGGTYNANFVSGITGGSGGTGSDYGAIWNSSDVTIGYLKGGGGGGGIELGSAGTLTINGTATITANGADGDSYQAGNNYNSDGMGGGSGGGVFIHSFNVTLASGAAISVNGGNGGAGVSELVYQGGGGGGGRIYIAAHSTGTLTNNGASITVSGGLKGAIGTNGNDGNTGTSTVTQVNNNALPAELISFSASENGSLIELKWSTATEVNNFGFEIERLQDYKIAELQNLPAGQASWDKIGFVKGNGNSNSPKSYSFADNLNLSSGNYSYRLKQIDNDGQFEYSSIVEVSFNSPAEFSLKQNYPNPFNPSTKISYALPSKSFVTLKVYDVIGNEVASLVNQEQAEGEHNISFDASSLSSGIYFYKLTAGSFVKTMKMILLR